MPQITFTPATVADASALATMQIEFETFLYSLINKKKRASRAKVTRALTTALGAKLPQCEATIAWQGKTPVGYAIYTIGFDPGKMKPTLYLEDLYLRPAFQRKGIGKSFMAAIRAAARKKKCATLRWTVWNRNPSALAFYLKIGAKPVGDAILMGMPV
jgi:GNAT superfamily N-acetyltransferase